MTTLIRVLIADDHFVVRQGLTMVLVARNGMEVVGEAATGREAVELARTLRPDVIIMDMMMPDLDGPQAIAAIKQENPDARILVLTSFGENEKVLAAIRAGALGYLLKESSREDLLKAVRDVAAGNMLLPPELAFRLAGIMQNPAPVQSPPPETLTERELQVLTGIARGLTNQAIGVELGLSVNTVNSHVRSLYSKLGLKNRAQATLYAVEHNLTA
ncbi:MAG: response regulator transcription factor [Anaerolineae bacterium]